MRGRGPAHVGLGPEARTDRRPLRPAEDAAPVIGIELYAARACRLAARHAGNRAGDGGCDATGAASRSAIHDRLLGEVGDEAAIVHHPIRDACRGAGPMPLDPSPTACVH
uniref:Uncharacterized protein n=1 Tax=Ralstonia solanacearum TaxID=305 RepID=A0A0S4TW36_RALSL|nr:protein of unknown function [Ralstonia solanacearum]